jgi:hypothetical protein
MSEPLKADGFDKAIIGQCCVSLRLIYDINKMANILILRDNMTLEEAMEYISYNCIGAYVGEMTPIFLNESYELQ